MLQGIILDWDGTVSPTMMRQFNWLKHWANVHDKELKTKEMDKPFDDVNKFLTFYNKILEEGGPQLLYDRLELPCDMNDSAHPVWLAYNKYKEENPAGLYPGMKETILELWEMGHLPEKPDLNTRMRLAINTTNSWKPIRNELVHEGLLHCFDSFVTQDTLALYHGAGKPDEIKKPSKISLALTLDKLQTEAGYTIHVGDTRDDLAASQNIVRAHTNRPETLITVGAAYGYEGRQKLEQGVVTALGELAYFDFIIDEPKELLDVVQHYI
jgi:phosphoglycolate phosphatase-like HAD superfamily hydrolase